MRTRLTIEDLQEAARRRGGECLSTVYVVVGDKLDFRCAMGHEWTTAAMQIRAGHWCPACARQKDRSMSIEPMRLLAGLRGGECLSTAYAGVRDKLDFRCAMGHEWTTAAARVRAGHWCPACAHQRKRLGIEPMQLLAQSRGGRCLSTVYVNANTRLAWECAAGHAWLATPANVKCANSWCPRCSAIEHRIHPDRLVKPRPKHRPRAAPDAAPRGRASPKGGL